MNTKAASHFTRRLAVAVALTAISAVSSFAQTWTQWSTSGDIRSGSRGRMVGTVQEITSGNRFQILPDTDRPSSTVTIIADSLATQYVGFSDAGTTSDAISGPAGFSRIRTGDRIEVRGTGSSNLSITADQVTLLGRRVHGASSSSSGALRDNQIEGVVRQVTTDGTRIVIENDSRRTYTVTGSTSTPVYFRGETYQMRNIEVGDRIRVDVDSTSGSTARARSIDVLESVTDIAPSSRDGRRVTSLYGRVTRIDARNQTFRIDTSRERDLRIDARVATDEAGRAFRMSDLRAGDVVEVTGDYDSAGQFRASTVRFGNDVERGGTDQPFPDTNRFPDDRDGIDRGIGEYVSVILYGTVDETLKNSETLGVKDSTTSKGIRLMVDSDFAVRTKSGTYVSASTLKIGDRLAIKAFRDNQGRYIAQTIRFR